MVFLFLIELPYSLNPAVNAFESIAVYDAVIMAYGLAGWQATRFFLLPALEALTTAEAHEASYSPREWQISFGLGITLTLVLVLTNTHVQGSLSSPITWLYILSQLIENSLLGWIVFALLASANQITFFITKAEHANLYDISPYRPVASWCLSVAIAVMGAATVAALFLQDDIFLQVNLITYAFLAVFGVFVFFAGMWSTHRKMHANKELALYRINTELYLLHQAILEKVQNNAMNDAHEMMNASAGLGKHKKDIEAAPEWPYTLGNLGGLLSSMIVPVVLSLLGKIF